MTWFGIRLFSVSIINYLFGNIMFAILWKTCGGYLMYWQIAIVCTFLASLFSFQTQSRFILKQETKSFFNPRYTLFQLFGLLISIIAVPALTSYSKLDLVVVQFLWSAFFSLLSLLVLGQTGFDSRSKP